MVHTLDKSFVRARVGAASMNGAAAGSLVTSGERANATAQSHGRVAGAALRVLLVVAGKPDRSLLTGLLRGSPTVAEVYPAGDAADALRLLQDHEVDLAFVDVELPGLDGIELARVLRRFARPPAVVFIADAPSRAVDAFEVGAIDFLLAPVLPERLAKAMRRADAVSGTGGGRAPGGLSGVPSSADGSNVRWMIAQQDYVRVRTSTAEHLINAPLALLVDAWAGAGIMRIHRSYAVQLSAVTELRRGAQGYSVVVDGQELPVSRRLAPSVRSRLIGIDPD